MTVIVAPTFSIASIAIKAIPSCLLNGTLALIFETGHELLGIQLHQCIWYKGQSYYTGITGIRMRTTP